MPKEFIGFVKNDFPAGRAKKCKTGGRHRLVDRC